MAQLRVAIFGTEEIRYRTGEGENSLAVKGNMPRNNTTLDDISAEIGFTAAVNLSLWRGGRNLYVAARPTADGALVRVVGMEAVTRLADAWGGETLAIPDVLARYEQSHRTHRVWELSQSGASVREIALVVNVTERRVQQIRRELHAAGLLPRLARRRRRQRSEEAPQAQHSAEAASQGQRAGDAVR